MIDFQNKVALVTGAGRGLGRLYAQGLAERSARVIVNDVDVDVAQEVAESITKKGHQAIAIAADISQKSEVENLLEKSKDAYGTLDILVSNAGILRDRSFHKMEDQEFKQVLDVNLMASYFLVRQIWESMRQKGYGRIVLTSSASALYGNFGQSNYGTAKLALVGMMNSLKVEGEKKNIHINTIVPAATTRLTERLLPESARIMMNPKYVVPGVLFLCSDGAPNGVMLSAGARNFSRVHIMETQGVRLEHGQCTPEEVAKNWDRIQDTHNAQPFDHASKQLAFLLKP